MPLTCSFNVSKCDVRISAMLSPPDLPAVRADLEWGDKSVRRPATRVEQELLISRFDQGARTETID